MGRGPAGAQIGERSPPGFGVQRRVERLRGAVSAFMELHGLSKQCTGEFNCSL